MQKLGRFMAVRTYQNMQGSTKKASGYSKTGKTKPDRFTTSKTTSRLKSLVSKIKKLIKKAENP